MKKTIWVIIGRNSEGKWNMVEVGDSNYYVPRAFFRKEDAIACCRTYNSEKVNFYSYRKATVEL